MTKYVRVSEKELPTEFASNEFLIPAPNFITEIKACEKKAPKSGQTSPNYLKEIAAAIGDKYLSENFNALMDVNVSKYRGIDITSDEVINGVVMKMMQLNVPGVLDAYIDYHIKQRPEGTKLIYFLGDHLHTTKFTMNGIDELKKKEIGSFMGSNKKKVVSNSDQ